jgi:aminoglycoside 2''-phosphotransferase
MYAHCVSPLITRGDFVVIEMDIKIQKHLETLKNIVPFEISSVILHEGGDDFRVLEINGEWMFRFPRNEISRKALQVEKGFLARFKAISPLPVPDHKYSGDDFVGYPKITGALLDAEVFQSLSKKGLARIARQMGQFLSAVHTFPVDKAKHLGVTEGWSGYHQQAMDCFRDEIAPRLSNSALQKALTCMEGIMSEVFDSKVIHGDFALEDHVFFDEEKQQLCGVIDFADVTINDPAHDFQNIFEYGGEAFFQNVMEHYQIKSDTTLLKRTKLRSEARPLFETAYSLMFGFEKRFKERMEYIEAKYG